MRTRRRTGDDAINASEGSRFSALGDALWSAQDGVRTAARRALEWISWTVRRWLVWPLHDRAETAGSPLRALGLGLLVLAAAGAGVAALLWAAPDRGKDGTTAAEVAAVQPRPAEPTSEGRQAKPAPTLAGAAPVFESGEQSGASDVGGAEPVDATAAAAASSSPSSDAGEAARASSQPDASSPSSSSASTSADKAQPERGPVAGPKAVAVARDFATAFVSYEIGGADDPSVQEAFEATTTPELSEALLRRPPRLPASVKVPKAKVLNVVPAPSHDHVFPISVSLLRVGTTSELRLEMEKLKGKRWRVTNVLG
jgi:hypothetical protein